ncbi:MAG: hypothetical protein ACREQ9_05900 [Candidatus Binatia bacterium]
MNLEATNVAELSRERVPEIVDVITVDLSYVPVAQAVPQLEAVRIADHADLTAAREADVRASARETAGGSLGVGTGGRSSGGGHHDGAVEGVWSDSLAPSPVRGARGAREWLLHAWRAV